MEQNEMTLVEQTDEDPLEAGRLIGGLPAASQTTSAYRDSLYFLNKTFASYRGTSATSSGRSDQALIETHVRGSTPTKIYFFSPETDFPRGELASASSNAVPDGTPRWFNYLKRRLDYLQNYPVPDTADDDAYPKPPEETVKTAWQIAYKLFDVDTPTPSIVPADEGGVEFAWHKNGWDLVISALPEETLVWARNRSLGERWSFVLSEQWGRVQSILGTLK
jgi:hypothetical protein